ncbi:hypothetical protein BC939DRAFT_434320 [Gamsiella multidivaricata]|uniref:uncharacterized protein n=1 Tax=Gamsiella multidivaricata TaxID=101098 RepID=UPI002220CEA2|nr:uncharacterized protein BC939DRAFT_434320 [Gamsiella multidivaricata]KAI7832774.1 hypothetical protein BC939DRAFT_434320 [Gamsiella multidivaricata]
MPTLAAHTASLSVCLPYATACAFSSGRPLLLQPYPYPHPSCPHPSLAFVLLCFSLTPCPVAGCYHALQNIPPSFVC